MEPEYDFSKGERGKFYREGAVLRLPIYLEEGLQERVANIAQKKGKDVGELVNLLVRRDVEIFEELS
ncbi:MAG: hypothetical protein HYV26_09810 [Candidatus Hydrogenedentes bacterium]|nr:hypothetical protein [Candidatus Hydrogenedentota bacterium]